VFQSRQLVKNNISHMNSSYFTEEHQLFRESLKDFLQKEVVPHIEKWEKTGTIERFIWKKFGEMGFFGINYPEAYGGLNLDLFYTVILLEELQKIKSSGFAAAMWAHSYLAMTHLNAEGDERMKQDYLVCAVFAVTDSFAVGKDKRDSTLHFCLCWSFWRLAWEEL
jgi:acyl-CoA dehydrogenase